MQRKLAEINLRQPKPPDPHKDEPKCEEVKPSGARTSLELPVDLTTSGSKVFVPIDTRCWEGTVSIRGDIDEGTEALYSQKVSVDLYRDKKAD